MLQSLEHLKPHEIITLFYIDFNNFKKVNDEHGHLAGDAILKKVSSHIKNCFREQDFTARIGGDEFVGIVIHAVNEEVEQHILPRIRQAKTTTIQKNKLVSIDVSVGHASTLETTNIETLIHLADRRMYDDKMKDCFSD